MNEPAKRDRDEQSRDAPATELDRAIGRVVPANGAGDSGELDALGSGEAVDSMVRPSAPTLDSSEPTPAPRIVVRTPSSSPAAAEASLVGDRPSGADLGISTTLRSGERSDDSGLVGRRLGRYEVVEELGHGGMATVYRGFDPRLGRNVALKVIHRHLRENPEIAQRFRHEARAVAMLKHPCIVEIYDVPDDGAGERFLVAELVEGPSLRRYLQSLGKELAPLAAPGRRACMPPEIAACIVLQVLSALAAAHREGIVHRDVKPENILLGGLGGPTSQRPSDPQRTPPTAKLTDFGIAKILDTQGMTSTGQILGSPAHMAPEQIEGHEVGPRVDLFATGVLFYELTTGELPFDGKNPAQVIRRVLDGQFTPVDRVDPSIGGRWAAIIASLLAREPSARPESAEAVEKEIRAELAALGIDDPNATLLSFLADPPEVAASWPARMKERLVARAATARAAGDVIGAAHDLNRALAYDPLDRKLVESVSGLRGRARRLAMVRRLGPIVAAAALVVSGSYLGVRAWKQRAQAPAPVVSARASGTSVSATPSANPAPVGGAPSASSTIAASLPSTTTTNVAAVADAGHPVGGATLGTTTGGAVASASAGANGKIGRVKFTFFPRMLSSFQIDGATFPVDELEHELAVGAHALKGVGARHCCEVLEQKFNVAAGADAQTIAVRLRFLPAQVFYKGTGDGDAELVVRRRGGAELKRSTVTSNGAPLSVSLGDETQLDVIFELTPAGGSALTRAATLEPGSTYYLP
jgi:serine/threonine protein kinase